MLPGQYAGQHLHDPYLYSMRNILLLHGAIGTMDQLEPLAERLRENYNVYLFNFPGHGGTAFPAGDFSISLFSASVVRYLDEQQLDAVDIFGYSMGGYVAMHLASLHPERVEKIITLATKFYWDPSIAVKETKMLNAATIELKVPAYAQQLAKLHAPSDWKIVLEKTKALLTSLGDDNVLQTADFSSIQNECLLLLGENDKMVTREETAAVKDLLPNATFELLSATPHPIEQVDVNKLVAIIEYFLV